MSVGRSSIYNVKYNTYGKNLKALTSKVFFVNASLISSSVQDDLEGKHELLN